MRDKFYFFSSFRDTARMIKDEKLRLAYLEAVIDYGIAGIDPPDPMIQALLVQTKFTIDRSSEISLSAKERGKKGGAPQGNKNACKDWENDTKQPKQAKTTKNKLTQAKTTEEEVEVEEEREVEIINTKLSSNEESILTDNKKKKSDFKKNSSLKIIEEEKEKSSAKKEKEVYGNLEINKAIALIKSYNGGIMNGSDGKQRQFANHLIKKLKKLTSVQEGRFTWQSTLEMILKIVSESEYHSSKIASAELIYHNLASLMQICKAEFQKSLKPTIAKVKRV